jgi:hypothetical protein
MAKRKRVNHTATFEERLAEETIKLKAAAETQPPGRPLKRNPLVAWPENCFCDVPGRLRQHHTSTLGFDLPDYSHPRL